MIFQTTKENVILCVRSRHAMVFVVIYLIINAGKNIFKKWIINVAYQPFSYREEWEGGQNAYKHLFDLISFMIGHLPSKLPSIGVCLWYKLSSIEGYIPSIDFCHQMLFSIRGSLSLNVVFNLRSSLTKGFLPSKVIINLLKVFQKYNHSHKH